jgi:hypothetical protein
MLLVCLPATAQQSKLSVASFTRMETDITARITAPKRDQNGEICAIVRIVTPVKDFMFEPDALGVVARENKTGEIWLYVPRGARRISILHDQLGILRNYFYPDIIERGTVYEMVLNTGDQQDKPVVENNMQFFVLRPDPANANVYVDDEQVPVENGLFSATMPKGEHTYRVEAPMYQPDAGAVTLGNEQVIKSVTLKPKFGYMEIFSLPVQDADVIIDSVNVGKTPYRSDRMGIRDYRVRIEKPMYFPVDTVLTVTAGETVRPTFHLISTIKPKIPINTLILLQVGYNPNGTSYGAMLGFGRKNGFYAGFRTDLGSASGELECDADGVISGSEQSQAPFYAEGVKHVSRMSATVGYFRQLGKAFYLYVGAGYGSRTLTYELAAPTTIGGQEYAAGTQVKDVPKSPTGVAAELGGILKMGKFCFTAGYHTVNAKYHEASVGLGIIF